MEDIENELKALEANPNMLRGLNDARQVPATILLTRAVLRLDKTSSRLAIVNIALTVVLAIMGAWQIYLMVHGH